MILILISLLLQSLVLPPRVSLENPASLTPIPQKLKKDFDKAWVRFVAGKEDAKLAKDLEKLMKKQRNFDSVIAVQAYLDLCGGKLVEAENRLAGILGRNPDHRIALYYLAELAYLRNDYARANGLYARLVEIDSSRPEIEMKRQKTLLLATENLLRNAAQADSANRFEDAVGLYRQALRIAPREPALHGQLGALLARLQKWDEALSHYRLEAELESTPNAGNAKRIAEALMHLGRTEEARNVLSRLRDSDGSAEKLEEKVHELEDLGRWGGDIEYFHEIETAESVTREQISAMLVRYFPQITEFRKNPRIVTDVQNSWARPEIQTIVSVGLIDLFPNHTFRPDAPLTRGELALALARLFRLLNVSPASAPPIAAPDLVSSHALYADIQLVLRHNLMALEDSGYFNINGTVTGEQAVRAVERLLALTRAREA